MKQTILKVTISIIILAALCVSLLLLYFHFAQMSADQIKQVAWSFAGNHMALSAENEQSSGLFKTYQYTFEDNDVVLKFDVNSFGHISNDRKVQKESAQEQKLAGVTVQTDVEQKAKDANATVTIEEAQKAALDLYSVSAYVVKTDFHTSSGYSYYIIQLVDKGIYYQVSVDCYTKAVLVNDVLL